MKKDKTFKKKMEDEVIEWSKELRKNFPLILRIIAAMIVMTVATNINILLPKDININVTYKTSL